MLTDKERFRIQGKLVLGQKLTRRESIMYTLDQHGPSTMKQIDSMSKIILPDEPGQWGDIRTYSAVGYYRKKGLIAKKPTTPYLYELL